MESDLKHYGRIVKKRLPLILLVSVVVAVGALVIAKQIDTRYEVHFSYLVSLSERDRANDFRFDGYYALQATDLFAATLAQWVETPEVVVAAYREGGLVLAEADPRALTRVVRAEKVAPQLVTVIVRESTQERAQSVAEGLKAVMERNVAAYHDEGVPAVAFTVVDTEPWTGAIRLSIPVIVASTFIFTFFIVLNGVLFIESLRNIDGRG